MFHGCTNLTEAPELPATNLTSNCYNSMFKKCTSLTTAPKLPAKILTGGCYHSMFSECTSLTKAPSLPATELAEGCYGYMFEKCTSLTTAPALPATELAEGCYGYMFTECCNLNYVKIGAKTPSPLYMEYWLASVALTGTLEVTNDVLEVTEDDINSLPQGWSLKRTSSIKNKLIGYIKVCGRKLEDINSTDDIVIIDNPHIYNVNERLHIDASNLTINGKKVVISFDDSSDLKEGHLLTKDDIGKKIIIKVEQI